MVWEFEFLVLAEGKWETSPELPNHQGEPPLSEKLIHSGDPKWFLSSGPLGHT